MDNSEILQRYHNLSLYYLSLRPRSEKEMRDYLAKKAFKAPRLTSQIIEQIIDKLKSHKFINDGEFVKFWIEQRLKVKHKPIKVIEFELKQKGIGGDLIEETLSKFEDINEMDLGNAKELAKRKLEFYRNLDERERIKKVMGYLLRRGFSYDTVKKVLKH